MTSWLRENGPAWAAVGVLYSAVVAVLAVWVWSTHPPLWGVAVGWALTTALFVRRVRVVRRARLSVKNPHGTSLGDLT